MADVQLNYTVHYFKQKTKMDINSGMSVDDGDPVPWCDDKKPGILTKNQSRVDCPRCIYQAQIKGRL